MKFLAHNGGSCPIFSLWKFTELHSDDKQINLKNECLQAPTVVAVYFCIVVGRGIPTQKHLPSGFSDLILRGGGWSQISEADSPG